jgi:hypothetical protein
MNGLRFCNVDLDIESQSDLAILQKDLGPKVVVLTGGPVNDGCHLLRLETATQHDNPDDTICAFCAMLEHLSPTGKRAWRSAHMKVFDIGCQAIRSARAGQFSLRNETLRRAAKLGATVGVSIYRAQRGSK